MLALGHHVQVVQVVGQTALVYTSGSCTIGREWLTLEIFTRKLPGLEGLSNNERLDRLGLFSKVLRGDLIEVYKV